MQIIVLGAHRSGTSAVARIINMLGAYAFSEGTSNGVNDENSKGFWERKDIRKINDEFLWANNWDWHLVSSFNLEKATPRSVATYQREFRKILLDLESQRPWVIKEPRLSLLFPLIRSMLEIPFIVHVYRDPLESALSLNKRNKIPVEYGLALWESYNLNIINETEGLEHITISYNNLMENSFSCVETLYKALVSSGMTMLRMPSRKEVEAFISPDLYRQRNTSPKETPQTYHLYQKLYSSMNESSAPGKKSKLKLSEESQYQLQKHHNLVASIVNKKKYHPEPFNNQLDSFAKDVNKTVFNLQHLLKEMETAQQSLKKSWTWKIGSSIVNSIRTLSLRGSSLTAFDRFNEISQKFRTGFDAVNLTNKPSVDIVICVHNALEDTRRCIDSVIKNSSGNYRLIIINDGSDKQTTNYLRSLNTSYNNFTLIENDVAEGYTIAANQGLKASSSDYVIMLNSDTIVPGGWIDRIIHCGQLDESIGLIGPLSNAASWQSIPERKNSRTGDWAINELPEGMGVSFFDSIVQKISNRVYPSVPLLNGFCFAIKRKVIDSIGLFDEEMFPKGYGEENDYCIRAARNGFKNVIADDLYVYHAKSKSYGNKKRLTLSRKGGKALFQKYSKEEIAEMTTLLDQNKALAHMRQLSKESLLEHSGTTYLQPDTKPALLYIMPTRGGSGGSHSVVQEAAGLRQMNIFVQIANSRYNKESFFSKYDSFLQKYPDLVYYYDPDDLESLYLHAQNFQVVIATIYSSVKTVKNIVERYNNIMPAYYVQDYEPFFFDPDSKSYQEAKASYNLVDGIIVFAKTNWLREKISENHFIDSKKVVPSLDTNIFYPDFKEKAQSGDISITAMIRPRTPRRGAKRTMEVLGNLKKQFGDSIKIQIFGCSDIELQENNLFADFLYINHGFLNRHEVADVLRSGDLFLDLSDYQAFGRTGLEAMACGCIPVMPVEGGANEFLIDKSNGFLVDTQNIDKCYDAVVSIIKNRKAMHEIKNQAILTASNFNIRKAALSEYLILKESYRDFLKKK